MNNTDGIKLMFDHKEALTILARSLDPSKPNVMQQAVQVLAAVCLIPPLGHERVLEAITMTGEIKGCERFQQVVQGLVVKSHPSLIVSSGISLEPSFCSAITPLSPSP
jgi:diaphanous 2